MDRKLSRCVRFFFMFILSPHNVRINDIKFQLVTLLLSDSRQLVNLEFLCRVIFSGCLVEFPVVTHVIFVVLTVCCI